MVNLIINHSRRVSEEAQWELNDRPRVNHPGDNTLSASGNLVCHPEEDQVSNTDRMLNVNISDNRMLNVNVSDNRIESRGGEEQTTHVSTGFIPIELPLQDKHIMTGINYQYKKDFCTQL
jgi:hypothetical protein